MVNDDFERRFEIYKMSSNKSLVISLFEEADQLQRQKILRYEEGKLIKLKSKKNRKIIADQKKLLDQLKSIH